MGVGVGVGVGFGVGAGVGSGVGSGVGWGVGVGSGVGWGVGSGVWVGVGVGVLVIKGGWISSDVADNTPSDGLVHALKPVDSKTSPKSITEILNVDVFIIYYLNPIQPGDFQN